MNIQMLKTEQMTTNSLKGNISQSNATLKGYLLNINNQLSDVREEVFDSQRFSENINTEGKGLFELYKQQLDEVRKKIKVNLDKAKEEISNHCKKQDANNSRLERHINQLKLDNTEIENTLKEKKKRIDILESVIGPDELFPKMMNSYLTKKK